MSEQIKSDPPELTMNGVGREIAELAGGNTPDLMLDAALSHIISLRRERLAWAELLADSRAQVEALVRRADAAESALKREQSAGARDYQTVRDLYDAQAEQIAALRAVLQDVTDVAASRQRTEWRNDSEQEAIDVAYKLLTDAAAATPGDVAPRYPWHPTEDDFRPDEPQQPTEPDAQ